MGSGLPKGVKKDSSLIDFGIRIADCGFLNTKKKKSQEFKKKP